MWVCKIPLFFKGSPVIYTSFPEDSNSVLTFMVPWLLDFAFQLLSDSYPAQIWVTDIAPGLGLWLCGLPRLSFEGPLYSGSPWLWFHLPTSIPVLLALLSWDKLGPQMSVKSYGNFSREKVRMGLSPIVTLVGQVAVSTVFSHGDFPADVHANFKSDWQVQRALKFVQTPQQK